MAWVGKDSERLAKKSDGRCEQTRTTRSSRARLQDAVWIGKEERERKVRRVQKP
jgi:hypothetical protein